MARLRISLLGLATVCAVGMFSVAAASAANPAWKLKGSKLVQGKLPIKIMSGVLSELKGTVVLEASTIGCASAVVENAYIEGNGSGAGQASSSGIIFSKCTNVGPINCIINEPIETKQLKSHLITWGTGQGKIGELFEPSQGTEFVGISFKDKSPTEKCATKGPFPVKGSVAGEVKARGQDQKQEPLESVIGELAFPPQSISKVKLEGQAIEPKLSIGANPAAIFSGKFSAQLSGQPLAPFGVFYG
jgi:hypothetical protein